MDTPKLKLDPLRCPQPKPLTPAQKAMRDSLKPAKDAAGKPCLREFTPDGKLKAGGVTVYSDIAPDDNSLDYSKEGWKCKRTFLVDGLAITGDNGCGTLYNLAVSGAVPRRGDAHPYITNTLLGITGGLNFAADVIRITPHTSTQAKVAVDYAVLNGATQEASSDNDTNPGLLTGGSSVQTKTTNVDYLGNSLLCPYNGAYSIVDGQGKTIYTGGTGSGGPSSVAISDIQLPNQILRFQRRETAFKQGDGIIHCTNSVAWTIAGFPYPIGSLLCTRVENEPPDDGVSYVVHYEFQYAPGTPPGTYNPAIPGWQVGCFYAIQSGYAVQVSGALAQVAQAGQIPPDAIAKVFQIYSEVDFTDLNLN